MPTTVTTPDPMAAPYQDIQPGDFKIHLGISEQGKVYALAGNHKMALLYFRHAMHMCVEAGDPEVFFRVYLESALESMERLGYFEEVLAYTEKAIGLYDDNPPESKMQHLDLAYIHQKRGVVLLKQKNNTEAVAALKTAIGMMDVQAHPMPLAKALLRWASSAMHIDERRILAEQERHQYFSVRKENVDPSKAIRLPNEQMLQIN